MNEISRPKLIAVWFAILVLVGIVMVMAGVRMTGSTVGLLIALALLPPVLVLRFWPGADAAETVGEVIRGRRDR